MNTSHSKIVRALGLGLIIIVAFFIGHYDGGRSVVMGASSQSLLGQVGLTEEELIPLLRAWKILNEKYVGRASTTDQEKIWGAIKGIAESTGDPYTTFFDPEESKLFESEIKGNFEGVGMEIATKDNTLTVVAPLKGSPAEKAGIQSGDKILKINDIAVAADMPVEKAVKLIRGPKGTEVSITIERVGENKPLVIKIVRDVITMSAVETGTAKISSQVKVSPTNPNLLDGNIYYLRLSSFTENSPELFKDALREFIKTGSNKLILDLRGNPGGYLNAAWDMASFFLPAGKVIVTEDFGPGAEPKIYRSKGYNVFAKSNLKMLILVDGGSASASEILAGALREQGVAQLLGVKTFGKGSVQELIPITSETALKVTVARWLTPNGVNLSKDGLIPDHVVEFGADDVKNKRDVQLQEAVKVMKKM